MLLSNLSFRSRARVSCFVVLTVSALLAGRTSANPPDLSPPFSLPGDDVAAPAAGLQEQPAIAAGGDGSLVVWADARSAAGFLASFTGGPFFEPDCGTMRDIYAARLDASGNLVDTIPIRVTSAALNEGDPAVAWNGENWLVVWMGQAGISCCWHINIYATRVSPAGQVLDDPPILVDADPGSSGLYWPTVTSDGDGWAVAWQDLDDGAGIFTIDGARVSASGAVLDPSGIRLRRDSYNSYPVGPELAFAGDEYLLVWNEASNLVRGQRLTSALAPLGPVFTINSYSPSSGKSPRVASDGSDFFVAWFEEQRGRAYGARVSHGGAVLDPAGLVLCPASSAQFTPTVAWDGTRWIVAYNYAASGFNDDIYVTRVSSAGVVLDPAGLQVAGGTSYQASPWIAPQAGGGARIVWQEQGSSPFTSEDIFAGSVSGAGVAGTSACIALGAPRQRHPDLAWNGSDYLAVFLSETSFESRILGQRMDANGIALDAEPFVIESASGFLGAPKVAWDGTRYLVTWNNPATTRILARRIALDGTLLDPAAIDVMPGNGPDVAALGGVFLVSGDHAPNHPHFRHPYVVRVSSADGSRLDPTPVLVGSYFATHSVVATLGARWLVAWQQNTSHDDSNADVWGNFVQPSGVAGASFAVTPAPIPNGYDPAIAVGGDTAMIAWATGNTNGNLAGRRIAADGTLLDPLGLGLCTAAGLQFDPAIAWTGDQFAVLFGDLRNSNPNGPYVSDVYGSFATSDGGVADPTGYPLANQIQHAELEPASAGGGGQAILGCIAFREESPFLNYRISYRLLNPATTAVLEHADVPPATVSITPNPTSTGARIVLRVKEDASEHAAGRTYAASVYDVGGRLVRDLGTRRGVSGVAAWQWDGRTTTGDRASAGVYYARLQQDGEIHMAKITLR